MRGEAGRRLRASRRATKHPEAPPTRRILARRPRTRPRRRPRTRRSRRGRTRRARGAYGASRPRVSPPRRRAVSRTSTGTCPARRRRATRRGAFVVGREMNVSADGGRWNADESSRALRALARTSGFVKWVRFGRIASVSRASHAISALSADAHAPPSPPSRPPPMNPSTTHQPSRRRWSTFSRVMPARQRAKSRRNGAG